MSGLRYLSVCSGIEAASVAWHGLGWTPVGFSEIEPFPSAVLQHHYPHVPNLGDMTNFKEWNLGTVDLLVGGTPCQSFSVAGLRKGLDDPRGNLMLTFLAIAERHRPRWIVWENVPGVLSSNGGRDFGTFLGALGELGYGWAYRVLDAQWFGVAQRRRRVFVVGCLGDQASAAAVLFESESVCRNPPPSREARQGAARGVGGGPAGSGVPDVAQTLSSRDHKGPSCGRDGLVGNPIAVAQPVAGSHWDSPANPHPTLNQSHNTGGIAASDQELFSQRGSGLVAQPVAIHPHVVGRSPTAGPQGKEWIDDGSAYCMDARGVPQAVAQPVAFRDPCPTLTAKMQGSSGWAPQNEDAHLVGVAQPVAMRDVAQALTSNYGKQPDNSDTALGPNVVMQPGSSVNASGPTVMQAVVYERHDQDARVKEVSVAPTLHSKSDNTCDLPMVQAAMQVRRLTPTECERLQGFPDGYTNIAWRKKDESPDGPRYKALGNSMAVPCMRWIGERIAKCDSAITKK